MAQYFTNFSENTVGAGTPSGWTNRIKAAAGANSAIVSSSKGNIFKLNTATGGSYVFGYNALNNEQDVETLTLFRIVDTGQGGRFGINYARYSGNSEASTKGYNSNFTQASNVLSVFVVEDSTGVINYTNYAWSLNTWYYMRFRVNGNTQISTKLWPATSAEPSSWLTDQSFSGPAITSPYSGVGHFVQNSSIEYKTFSAGTGGDTAPMYAVTDREQSGAFQVYKIPDSAPVNGYSGGYGGISGYGGTYGEAYIPTSTTVDNTQVGRFNVAQVYDKTTTGKFNVIKDYTNTQSGKFRVKATYDKTSIGKFRVKADIIKTQVGKFRTSKTFDQTHSGSFLIRKTYDNPQLGAFRVASEPVRLQLGSFLVQKDFTNTQVGSFSVSSPIVKTQLGKFRVKKLVTKTVIGKFRVGRTLNKTQSGSFLIRVTSDYDISGKFRVSQRVDNTQVGSFLVENQAIKNQVGKFAVRKLSDSTQLGKFRVSTTSTVSQSGRFSLQTTSDYDISGAFRIEYIGMKPQDGKFRIYTKDTLPAVTVPKEQYIENIGSYGNINEAFGDTGLINNSIGNYGSFSKASDIESKDYIENDIQDGSYGGNNQVVVLTFEDDSAWIDENGVNIIVQEYGEDDIINMIHTKGKFKEGVVEYGTIQKVI